MCVAPAKPRGDLKRVEQRFRVKNAKATAGIMEAVVILRQLRQGSLDLSRVQLWQTRAGHNPFVASREKQSDCTSDEGRGHACSAHADRLVTGSVTGGKNPLARRRDLGAVIVAKRQWLRHRFLPNSMQLAFGYDMRILP